MKHKQTIEIIPPHTEDAEIVPQRAIGELVLEIRGTTGALDLFMKAESFHLVLEQIVRGHKLIEELRYFTKNKHQFSDNLVYRDWLRIAQEEVKPLQTMLKDASSQLSRLKLLSF